MAYYSAIKRKTIDNAVAWMNPKGLILSLRNLLQKFTHCVILFVKESRKGNELISGCQKLGVGERF